MNVCIVGTGYVGLVTGACLSHVGHNVICADIDHEKIRMLNEGEVPIYEPGLEDLIKMNSKHNRLSFTSDIGYAVKESDIIFIAVGTPMGRDGEADLTSIFSVAEEIGKAMNGYKTIVDKSTVPVGTAVRVRETIKKYKTCEDSFSMVSNPEFLKEGTAIEDIFKGDRIVIGADNPDAEKVMLELYRPFGIPAYITDIASAELIKYASNAFLAVKISFINEIANICERVGADVVDVADGMGMDSRIGRSFLNAGLGYGGSCFPKDVQALYRIANENGYTFRILDSVMEINKQQRSMIFRRILDRIGDIENPVVGVWGLAFKPNTDDIRESPSIDIISGLVKKGVCVKAYDPVAACKAKETLAGVEYCDNPYDACKNSDLLFIATEWEEFRTADMERVFGIMKNPVIVDGRNIFDPEAIAQKGFMYSGVGRRESTPSDMTWS